jgi:hypothetical protein
MTIEKFEIISTAGQRLSARLDRRPTATFLALLAHCSACSKDVTLCHIARPSPVSGSACCAKLHGLGKRRDFATRA